MHQPGVALVRQDVVKTPERCGDERLDHKNRRSLADAHGQAVVKLAEAEAAEEARRICGNKKLRDQQGNTLQMRRDEETQLAEEMAASARSKGPCKRADASARDKGGQPGTGEDASPGAGEDASSGSRLRSRSKSSSTAMHFRARRSHRRSPPSTSEPASSSGITRPQGATPMPKPGEVEAAKRLQKPRPCRLG